jgi:hypothetical protein
MAGFVSVAIAEWRRGGHPISGRTLLAMSNLSGARRSTAVARLT